MRRAIALLILVSMTLHCASRLGVLSYVYENRHAVAFNLGLIKEVPIAVCSSDYEGDKTLVITTPDDTDKSLPTAISQAQEINLYFERTIVHRPNLPGLQRIAFRL